MYEFIGQPKKSSTHNPFKDGCFAPVKHERKSHSVPPRCASRAATNAPPYLRRIKGSKWWTPIKTEKNTSWLRKKYDEYMVNIWEMYGKISEKMGKDGKYTKE